MELTTSKTRTPSRCREWERNRRNKFNDAITRLGEIVKVVNRANNVSKDGENVQYPKIEIVEKAIVCLSSCVQENTQLKAEILALQVKIDSEHKQKENKKDVSTQVFTGIKKRKNNNKFVKVVMLKKSKRKALEEKSVLTTNATVEPKISNTKPVVKDPLPNKPKKLPMLLPKSNTKDKKGPENTIVVVPAAPYIIPQRPFLLPTVPPTFFFLDSNLQPLNKSSFPIINRSNNDITKTTMVNILPISAYSRPFSAVKTKKNNSKSKSDTVKKPKRSKQVTKTKEQISDVNKTKLSDKIVENNEKVISNESSNQNIKDAKEPIASKTVVGEVNTSNNNNTTNKNIQDTVILKTTENATMEKTSNSKTIEIIEIPKVTIAPTEVIYTEVITSEKPIVQKDSNNIQIIGEKSKPNKVPSEKEVVDKNKDSKLPNILDTGLCENTVDGGNARLELAEELLAASPTAAFLMSFPLVSGNRADSPAEETPNTMQVNPKDNNLRRNEIITQSLPYFEKSNSNVVKDKPTAKAQLPINTISKQNAPQKYVDSSVASKQDVTKTSITTAPSNAGSENPFLNLPMSSLLTTNCTLPDSTFGLDFDCNINKAIPTQSSSFPSTSNFFYKSDPFSNVKSTIYSTSSISSGHEFNSFGLYPCAMEKYTAKNKSDYPNVEDNLMKIGSSRLTYDIDLGWSHKGFDFVNCTSAPNTFNKDSILPATSGTYSSSYNPFNPDFHVPLVSNTNKKDNSSNKPSSSFSETISNFYSQPTSNLWTDDIPFYTNTTNNNTSKPISNRHQNYLPVDHTQTNLKLNTSKQYEPKQINEVGENTIKPLNSGTNLQMPDKFTKKSPSKMHINWMTSEIRPMQNNCNSANTEIKESHKPTYGQLDQHAKKVDHSENNYFPISMHNFPSQPVQEEMQVWSSARPAGTTEISIDPPPINLPTLVGDLALGPHDKRKNADLSNRGSTQSDIQNCSNFFSVTQLMNRSTDSNIQHTRYQVPNNENQKSIPTKQNVTPSNNDNHRKTMSRIESHVPQPYYVFNEPKPINSFENMSQYPQTKIKPNKSDKSSKAQKNSYSAEALLRGGTCNQKLQDNSSNKFMIPSQKYNDFNIPQDTSVAQVSHFPPILDYSDNSYTSQQFSGTNLYNSTTNTISNSFYTNFMPGNSNLMSGNYTNGPFASDYIDYSQTTECNYPNHKYSELKIRNNSATFQQDKVPSNYKSSRRESAAKHKLECSKKDSSKKCQTKRAKLNSEMEEWNDPSHVLWQNKTPNKRHSNLMSEELPFPNYMGNQVAGQYQPDFFNSHIVSSNMQGHNVDRSVPSFPVTSRANFNLSTIFPEITMKVQ